MPRGRVELPLSCENRILSPARLPVPPSGLPVQRRALCSTTLTRLSIMLDLLFYLPEVRDMISPRFSVFCSDGGEDD